MYWMREKNSQELFIIMSANDCFWSKNFGYLFFHHSSINIVIFPKKKNCFINKKKTDVYEYKKKRKNSMTEIRKNFG